MPLWEILGFSLHLFAYLDVFGQFFDLWASLGLSGHLWASLSFTWHFYVSRLFSLGFSGFVLASLGFSGPLWAYLGLSLLIWASLGLALLVLVFICVSALLAGFAAEPGLAAGATQQPLARPRGMAAGGAGLRGSHRPNVTPDRFASPPANLRPSNSPLRKKELGKCAPFAEFDSIRRDHRRIRTSVQWQTTRKQIPISG